MDPWAHCVGYKNGFYQKSMIHGQGTLLDPPKALIYLSVISRELVRIALLMAGLNELEVCLTNIGNAYLTAPTTD